ncbi:helix-turn-helix domain-containing protein [Clostridium beijerinckii]|uniref:Helix-turn-helix transcriptional regulator n=1 Tax=Clostridium beijerinckii TaxID=1520 RepID=A0AAW3W8Y2_CLOBE|nr:helix-turn-helix transcriptional regulator [Clostridium beijerinckii]MBC2458150.1 helix-turn-helix transcriptional regulator [Clostridium beijerinckii]MBC2475365.1 helix-turn-helix transcriptional regulator [Clostridium beijerinckii]NOV62583.1 transcriptional regulator with XRE-family HTH domain [Clostridium beijerinckii]NOV70456.1 transcriptional regulator with XRE-family HTH domain [Clostridium beijerinckii]NOW30635.1 transcriptional regulator with XRE-family HTH domain [Clostridium beije
MSISDNIKKIRKNNNLTQKQFAESINKKEITVRRYEKGDIIPPISVINVISEKFDVPMLEIIGDDPNSDLNYEFIKYAVDKADNTDEFLDKMHKKPSQIKKEQKFREEMNGIMKAVEDMLANEYIEKEYGYKYNELSFDDQSELYGFMHKMLKIKIDEIKLRNK